VTIGGKFRGAISTKDVLIVGENAVIEAEVMCGAATIAGEVTGNVVATDSVALQSTARVKGDITSPALSVDRGAMFDGAARMATRGKKPPR
jgi:cytoskeletal protein CcmA (bactofilin family)